MTYWIPNAWRANHTGLWVECSSAWSVSDHDPCIIAITHMNIAVFSSTCTCLYNLACSITFRIEFSTCKVWESSRSSTATHYFLTYFILPYLCFGFDVEVAGMVLALGICLRYLEKLYMMWYAYICMEKLSIGGLSLAFKAMDTEDPGTLGHGLPCDWLTYSSYL